MIASFREDWLRAFFVSDVRHRSIPAAIEARLFRRLQLMDDAKSDKDLRAPPSNHFEKLKGYLADYHSIRVNQNTGWCFAGTGEPAKHPISISTTTAIDEVLVLTTKREPASVGEILVEEFLQPLGLTQGALAEAMGVPRKHVNELCRNRRIVTAATALILARVFDTSPEFWLNLQRRTDLWTAMNSPAERERIERAKPLNTAA